MLKGVENPHQYEELIKVFLPKGACTRYTAAMEASGTVIRRYPGYPEFLTRQDVQDADPVQHPVCQGPIRHAGGLQRLQLNGDREALKREIYEEPGAIHGQAARRWGDPHRDKAGEAGRRDPWIPAAPWIEL